MSFVKRNRIAIERVNSTALTPMISDAMTIRLIASDNKSAPRPLPL